MQLRKILEKEMAKSNGQAELVKVPQERRPNTESLKKRPRSGRDAKDDLKPGDKIKKRIVCTAIFFLSINSAYCKQT